MYAAERQRHIVASARRDGRVEVAALAESLAVTAETIRRDLAALESRGLVQRVHGGALPLNETGFEPSLSARESARAPQKARIAQAALPLIDAGVRSVLLDAGSTTTALAAALTASPGDRELTVVTNSLAVAGVVATDERLHLHLLGGRVRRRTQAAVGSSLAAQVASIGVDIAFLGTNGLHPSRGVTTPDDAEADAKRLMVTAAQTLVVLADSSKLGQTHLCHVADLDDVDVVVTDAEADEDALAQIQDAGPEVLVA